MEEELSEIRKFRDASQKYPWFGLEQSWQPGEPQNAPFCSGSWLRSHGSPHPHALSLYPCCPKTGGSIVAAATCVTLGDKRHATHPSVTKEEPSQGSSRGRRVLPSPPAVSSPRVTLAVAMGEVVARSQGWMGRVQPCEVEVLGLGNWVLGRGELPYGRRPGSARCVPLVAGHS